MEIGEGSKQLWARFFKGRYFKHCDVMEASLGTKPSYIWRSLIWSRDLLGKGLLWRVGDDNVIGSIRDARFPGLPIGQIKSRLATPTSVSKFITTNRSWNEELLRDYFLSYEVEGILQIPLC